MRWHLYALCAFIVLVRLTFLPQAIQGDDPYYLAGGMHALIEPAHPHHATYYFQGDLVSMQGHPHPPLNAWILAGLIALFGDVYEVRFHFFYLFFSLLAVRSMWSIASRFTVRPGFATLLFTLTPAFFINGNSLETDVPFVALWLAAMALFLRVASTRSRPDVGYAALMLMLTALMSYQAVVLIPILLHYVWWRHRRWIGGYVLLCIPIVTAIGFQAYERLTSGTLPAQVLTGYFTTYGLQTVQLKLLNAAALTSHLGWLVFPLLAWGAFWPPKRWHWLIVAIAAAGAAFLDPNPLFWGSFATGALILAATASLLHRNLSNDDGFLAAWILAFFAAALVLFYAGSARYLLPISAPLAILIASRISWRPRYLSAALATQLAIVFLLAVVNYRHWQSYQRWVAEIKPQLDNKRVWINSEWGLRYYLEALGGLPVAKNQAIQPDDILITSRLAYPVPVNLGGGEAVTISQRTVEPPIPLRLIGLGAHSGYATAAAGLRPFDITNSPIDVVTASIIVKRDPTLSFLTMDDPDAARHLIRGVYALEGKFRWIADQALIALKPPPEPRPLQLQLFVPDSSPASHITIDVDGHRLLDQPLRRGGQTITTPPALGKVVQITLDKTFRPTGDSRDLGLVLTSIGYLR